MICNLVHESKNNPDLSPLEQEQIMVCQTLEQLVMIVARQPIAPGLPRRSAALHAGHEAKGDEAFEQVALHNA